MYVWNVEHSCMGCEMRRCRLVCFLLAGAITRVCLSLCRCRLVLTTHACAELCVWMKYAREHHPHTRHQNTPPRVHLHDAHTRHNKARAGKQEPLTARDVKQDFLGADGADQHALCIRASEPAGRRPPPLWQCAPRTTTHASDSASGICAAAAPDGGVCGSATASPPHATCAHFWID
jgi:hypothetical protein